MLILIINSLLITKRIILTCYLSFVIGMVPIKVRLQNLDIHIRGHRIHMLTSIRDFMIIVGLM